VVLIAGNGHVRKDIGVGYWLQQVTPALTVRSVGFIEGREDAGRYDSIQCWRRKPATIRANR
jgi:uncharacterized iron-regulated protein